MKTLSFKAFDRACQFLLTEARPLESALFRFHFQNEPASQALFELAEFQNEDGGFGQALEPDVRNPHSSALATGIALQLMKILPCCPEDHPMVTRAVQYLLNTFDHETHTWRVVPPGTSDFPHAPWWQDQDGTLSRTFDQFQVIPRAQIVSLLYTFNTLVPAGWLAEVTERTVAYIEAMPPVRSGGGDDLVYALMLAENQDVPGEYRERVGRRLREIIPQVVSRDPEQWKTYVIEPLKLAPRPDSLAAPLLEDILPLNLDFRIEQQTEAGTWDPVWSWGDGFPEDWERARREWQGDLTLNALLTLRAYGRLPSEAEARLRPQSMAVDES